MITNINFGDKVSDSGVSAFPTVGITKPPIGINDNVDLSCDLDLSGVGLTLPPIAGHDGEVLNTDGTSIFWSGISHTELLDLTTGDPHTQYLNNTRGDLRYLLRAAGDIDSFTQKSPIVDADILLLEDSEDSFAKKKVIAGDVKDKYYLHNQTVAASVWTVHHGFGRYPTVNVIDANGKIIYGLVENTSLDDVQVTFGEDLSGKVICS